MKQDFKSGQSITFSSAGRAADGGAWELVIARIVMGRVRIDLAEVVFGGRGEGEGGLCEAGWNGRSEMEMSRRDAATVILEATTQFRWGLSTKS